MQYLFKVSSTTAPRWRLVALDGTYTLAEAAELIVQAFGYVKGSCTFVLPNKQCLNAGCGGQEDCAQAAAKLDSLKLAQGDSLDFAAAAQGFYHHIEVLRAQEHLYCLMPSCLVGAGLVPADIAGDEAALTRYAAADEAQSLDLRDCTKRMRAYLSAKRHAPAPALTVPFAPA